MTLKRVLVADDHTRILKAVSALLGTRSMWLIWSPTGELPCKQRSNSIPI